MSIQVKNITHIYSEGLPHESKAIDDVSFDIDDGQFVGLIGHTGSGKSTLVQHLNGLLKPKSGSIFIGGKDITESGVILRDKMAAAKAVTNRSVKGKKRVFIRWIMMNLLNGDVSLAIAWFLRLPREGVPYTRKDGSAGNFCQG